MVLLSTTSLNSMKESLTLGLMMLEFVTMTTRNQMYTLLSKVISQRLWKGTEKLSLHGCTQHWLGLWVLHQ